MTLMDIVFIPWILITTITIPVLMRDISRLNTQQKELKREVDKYTKANSILHSRQTELHLKWETHAAILSEVSHNIKTLQELVAAANRPGLFEPNEETLEEFAKRQGNIYEK